MDSTTVLRVLLLLSLGFFGVLFRGCCFSSVSALGARSGLEAFESTMVTVASESAPFCVLACFCNGGPCSGLGLSRGGSASSILFLGRVGSVRVRFSVGSVCSCLFSSTSCCAGMDIVTVLRVLLLLSLGFVGGLFCGCCFSSVSSLGARSGLEACESIMATVSG
jgi:hypothetical protein